MEKVVRKVLNRLLRKADGIRECADDMAIAQEEIFGPVLCVIAYDTEEDAVRIANDSRHGLHAAVLGPTFSARVAWLHKYGPGAW